ncbi:MAG TPA: hypothetical protein VHV74_17250 [Pseudonocardiaceae bacterium]|nr:hypothetical protein [Pseudonocardiaceae bacterium]
MGAMVLACGRARAVALSPTLASRSDVTFEHVPQRPGKDDVDDLLATVGPDTEHERVVVVGDDADLAAVVLRLLRTERLVEVPVGFAPLSPASDVVATWNLPAHGEQALDLALDGEPRRVPLIRDDNGGVLVGLGQIGPLRGVAYCDDTLVLRGPARSIVVRPHATGVEVAVHYLGRLRRRSGTIHGRAFELGCLPTLVTRDGVPHDRPVKRWNWYRHTEDLRLIRV